MEVIAIIIALGLGALFLGSLVLANQFGSSETPDPKSDSQSVPSSAPEQRPPDSTK